MTRPQIIRADTIDLQDSNAPSAQDHTHKPLASPLGIGPAAPHQASELRHVQQERAAEEDNLSHAWHTSHTVGLSEEPPGDDDEATYMNGHRHDQQAPQQNGGKPGAGDEEVAEGDGDENLEDDMMDKISSSPSIDDEDIDFEFVYALHTFVATVEGQANATKGDTMVLLDDSNSYWWLVRVVKDSTIGYLPAEHIETPTERLARLNKHRNIDLSATMLGDTTEKTKNPLKKAMRRRNAKQVSFGNLNYIEASDYEYSSDEDEDQDKPFMNGEQTGSEELNGGAVQEPTEDDIAVAPLSVKKETRSPSPEKSDIAQEGDEESRRRGVDESRASDEAIDRQYESQGPRKTRNGNIRNTDSFFKDDTVETRKITLTPNLLRDDSNSVAVKLDTKSRGSSFESIDRDMKPKDDKKKKEKKPGMLSGIFKRSKEKDKKKGRDGSPESPKLSPETSSIDPRGSNSEDISPLEKGSLDTGSTMQRKPSNGKLQKSHPGQQSSISPQEKNGVRPSTESDALTLAPPTTTTPRGPSPEKAPAAEKPSLRVKTPEAASNMLSDMANKLRSPQDGPKREKVKKAKTREALDVDSSPEEEKAASPFSDTSHETQRKEPDKSEAERAERLSESPVQITSADAQPDEPPALVGDNSSSNSSTDELTSLRSSPSPPVASATVTNPSSHLEPVAQLTESHSPTSPISPLTTMPAPLSINKAAPSQTGVLVPQQPNRSPPPQPGASPSSPLPPVPGEKTISPPPRNNSTSTNASTNASGPAWSDASLRHYLDSNGIDEIRDLLLVVHDTTGVVPVGPEHELMKDLFVQERGKVRELGLQLDGLLTSWLARKRGQAGRKTPATSGTGGRS